MNTYEKQNEVPYIIKKISLLCYYLLFVYVSFQVFMTCREIRNVWIIEDIVNGIGGGFFLVYPLNGFRYGWYETINNWLAYIVIMAILYGITSVISSFLGIG